MTDLAVLPLVGGDVVLRTAVDDDLPALVALIAADQLGAHRFYARLGFVASHEGMKLRLP